MLSMPLSGNCARKVPSRPAIFDVRRNFAILLVRERRQVDRILHHAQLQILAHLQRDLYADRLLRFGGRSGNVRSQNDVSKPEEGESLSGSC